MAVLIEGICVVVRGEAIVAKYAGGEEEFFSDVIGGTFCADGELARFGFTTPTDVKRCIDLLERRGLCYMKDDKVEDIVVVDQIKGMLSYCAWARFGKASALENGGTISICHAVPTSAEGVVIPDGWTYENSLSARHRFITTEEFERSLRFVRSEPGFDVYLDADGVKEFYVKRSRS